MNLNLFGEFVLILAVVFLWFCGLVTVVGWFINRHSTRYRSGGLVPETGGQPTEQDAYLWRAMYNDTTGGITAADLKAWRGMSADVTQRGLL